MPCKTNTPPPPGIKPCNPPAHVAPADADRLAALAPKVNRGHGAILTHQDHALQGACDVGRWLIEARDIVLALKGNWGEWIAKNCEFSRDTAERYMRIASNWDRVEAESAERPLSIDRAFQFLRDADKAARPPRQKKTPPPAASSQQEKSTENVPTSEDSSDVGTDSVSYSSDSTSAEDSTEQEVATETEPLAAKEPARREESAPAILPMRTAKAPQPAPSPTVVQESAGPSLQDRVIVELREENSCLRSDLNDAKVENLKLSDALAREKREAKEKIDLAEERLNRAVEQGVEARGENARLREEIERLKAPKGKPEPVTLPFAPPGFVACRHCANLVAIPQPALPTPFPGTVRVESEAERAAAYYEQTVVSGHPVTNSYGVIRERMLEFSLEQLQRMADGYAAHNRKHGHQKRESAKKFYSHEGAHRDFIDYTPPAPPPPIVKPDRLKRMAEAQIVRPTREGPR